MKRSKSIISMFLSAVIVLACIFCAVPAVSAATTVNYDGVIYTQSSPYEAVVSGYDGSATDITIPERVGSMTVIGVDDRAFYENSVVERIVLPRTVQTIGDWAFAYSPKLEYVDTSYNLTTIGFYAFAFSPSLSEVNINSEISELPPGLFQGSGLTAIKIPYNVKTIRRDVFSSCASLKAVNIPAHVTSVDVRAFINCTALTSVTFGDGSTITEIPSGAFSGCSALGEISIPPSVESIDSLAFENCQSLCKITIPDSTTAIAADAFANSPDVTVYCTKDSYAQSYAQENNIPFVLTDAYETGDADMDSDITVKDATLIQQYLAHLTEFDAQKLYLSDYDNNGRIDISDATAIQKFIAHLI